MARRQTDWSNEEGQKESFLRVICLTLCISMLNRDSIIVSVGKSRNYNA